MNINSYEYYNAYEYEFLSISSPLNFKIPLNINFYENYLLLIFTAMNVNSYEYEIHLNINSFMNNDSNNDYNKLLDLLR